MTEVEGIGRSYASGSGGTRNLYTVEIPDDTGENYLPYERCVTEA